MYDIIFCSKHSKNKQAYDQFKAQHPNAYWLTDVTTVSEAAQKASKLSMTGMYWLVTDDVIFNPDMDFSWKPEAWDRQYSHVWPTVDSRENAVIEFSGVYLIPKSYKVTEQDLENGTLDATKIIAYPVNRLAPYDIFRANWQSFRSITDACQQAQQSCKTEMHWMILDDVKVLDDWDFNWRPAVWDRRYVHVWKTSSGEHTGVYLIPGDYLPDGEESHQGSIRSIKLMPEIASSVVPQDIFFISYREPTADANYEKLRSQFPRAKRVHGVKGIHHAHIRCAELAETGMFFTVDADTVVDQGFSFDYRPPDYDRQYLHLWHSRNPINGLSYGWGAIKLWPTMTVREFRGNWLDFTTTVGNIKIIPEIVATTNYNCDQQSTWQSGFREAVKLSHNIANGDHIESLERLMIWATVAYSAPWADESMQGARAGIEYYLEIKSTASNQHLSSINDFDWLAERFNNRKQGLAVPDRSQLLSSLRG